MSENSNQELVDQEFIGLLAQFEDPDALVAACDQARQAGYKKMDAYSPFPVHGIDPAIGIRRTRLPFLVLAIGLMGCALGLFMQYYTNAAEWSPLFPGYAFKISGKPYFSLPANIPVTFEVIVLSSAIATFLGMWAINRLPRLANPLHRISRFKRVTNDKFFLMIEAEDPGFDRQRTEQQLNDWGASAIEEVYEDLTDQQMPHWVQTAGVLLGLLLLVPPVLIFRAQGMTNPKPRLHVVPDMDWQDKVKYQVISPVIGIDDNQPVYLFPDQRGNRPPVPGTIARGQLIDDPEYFFGIKADSETARATVNRVNVSTGSAGVPQDNAAEGGQDIPLQAPDAAAAVAEPDWVDRFPARVKVDEELVRRGKQRFEIYCAACHGYAGNGDGLVNTRAMSLNAAGDAAWTAAKSLHDPEVKKNPVGRIFDTITNGRNTMGPYGSQIPVADRWAIVAYVKALQETGIQPPAAPAAAAANRQTKSGTQ